MYKEIQVFALAIPLIMAACTADLSSSSSYGDAEYTRVLSKGDNASMQCNVYVDDDRVAIVFNLDYAMYNSMETIKIETRAGKPSVYTIDIETTGIFANDIDEACAVITEDLASDGGKTECSETEIHGKQFLGNAVSETSINYVVSTAYEYGKNRCDSWYDKYKDLFKSIPGEWGGDVEQKKSGEKASSCDVYLDRNLLTVSITYPDKSASMQMAVSGNVYSVVESYMGLDDETLSNICRSYRNNPEIENVVCQDAYFSYSFVDDESSLEDEAVYQKTAVCPALLSGEMALEDMWSN